MKERLEKMKDAAKRHVPVIIIAVAVTAVAVLAYQRKNDNEWTAYVLSQDARDEMARNSDAVVTFTEQKVMILGQPWNPDK